VTTAELERTRQLAESVTRQRDRLAADRDRLARARDDVAADRDRLRRDHEILARRLDRLEREAGLVAGAQGVAVAGAQRPAEATRVLAAPVRREPTRRYAPVMAQARSFDQPQPAAPAVATGRSTSDRRWGRDRWAPAGPSAAEPEPPRAALRESALLSRLRRMLRRLVAVTLLFLAFVILGVVGASALFDTSPDRVVARVLLVLDQVRDGSG
jgi:hypothetical protein